jgi:hypothetical protein
MSCLLAAWILITFCFDGLQFNCTAFLNLEYSDTLQHATNSTKQCLSLEPDIRTEFYGTLSFIDLSAFLIHVSIRRKALAASQSVRWACGG